MKKTAILMMMIVGTLAPRSMAAAETEVSLGLKVGPCISNVRWSLDDGSGETFKRLTAGVLIEVNLSPRFAVQPELDFVTMGYSWWDLVSVNMGKYEDTLQYLQIPVLFKARLIRKGWIVPAVFAGPSLGILLKAGFKFYDMVGGLTYIDDIKDLYRDFDLGAVFGAGVNIQVRNLRLIFDVRYYLGLTDVYRAADISVKNAGLMITGGLGF
jgi:hypothetical protein